MKPIGITAGCPAGVGPELVARVLSRARTKVIFFGSRALLDEGARRAKLPASQLKKITCALDDDRVAKAGHPDADALVVQRDALVAACLAAQRDEVSAIVTGPVRKKALVVEGKSYAGQTEVVAHFLADREPLMVFAGGPFLLGLATVHVPLVDVSAALSLPLLDGKIELLADAARQIAKKKNPRLVVLGVNPHAGEGGLFGREEIDVVTPAIERARARGLDVAGPLPADGFFGSAARGDQRKVDAVLAMHHDQGLAPYKIFVRGEGINVTWGARVVRTSPDHGTADALAGKNKASPTSMALALQLAERLVKPARSARAR